MSIVTILRVAAAIAGLSIGVGAQSGPGEVGQWEGPYDLSYILPFDPDTGLVYAPTVLEIVHLTVLPPRAPGLVADSHYAGKVLFITDRATPAASPDPSDPAAWEQQQQPTFVWIPDRSLNIEHVMVPNTAYEDVFCCAQTCLADGTTVTVGGLNRPLGGGPASRLGHGQSFRLRTDVAQWMGDLAWEKVTGSQSSQRYYPSAVLRNDGALIALGHTSLPPGNQELQREYLTNLVWGAAIDNLIGTGTPGSGPYCSGTALLNTRDYPKVHLLSNRDLMWVDGATSPAQGSKHVSWFVKVSDPAECAVTPDNPYRWRQGLPSLDPAQASQAGGNSVHLITRDRIDPVNGPKVETIYTIGGTRPGEEDKPCPCGTADASAIVHRMRNPSPTAVWEWSDGNPLSPPNLTYSRVNCVAVILLDGSIVVIGGTARDGSPMDCPSPNPSAIGCVHRRTPELLRPIEVFGASLTDPSFVQQWLPMAEQAHKRQYHSVGGLLPDGSVVSAGGTYNGPLGPPGQGQPDPDDHRRSVERFRPPYHFQARPSITIPPLNDTLEYGQFSTMTVYLAPGRTVSRVALLRNTSMTHAVDFNQRYVELQVNSVLPSGGEFAVTVTPDYDDFALPPGWYHLTVVDDLNIPSPAIWVHIAPLGS